MEINRQQTELLFLWSQERSRKEEQAAARTEVFAASSQAVLCPTSLRSQRDWSPGLLGVHFGGAEDGLSSDNIVSESRDKAINVVYKGQLKNVALR